MSRDKSVTVTRDTRDKTGVTFAVSHGTPTRPVPTRPILKYLRLSVVICLWSSLIFIIISQRARAMMTKIGGTSR